MRALACALALLAVPAGPAAANMADDQAVATCATHEIVVAGFLQVGLAELALADCADARAVLAGLGFGAP